MLRFSIVLWLRWLGKSAPRTGGCGGSAGQDVPKFAPRLRARGIWKSKSLKTERFGALLEVEAGKICTTPARGTIWKFQSKSLKTESLGALLEVEDATICTTPARENDLEVKIVNTDSVGALSCHGNVTLQ